MTNSIVFIDVTNLFFIEICINIGKWKGRWMSSL